MIRSFHLTNADPKQMMTMLKTVLKTKDIFLNEKINSIVIRDTPDAIRLAEKMIADQDIAEPEVMMEVEVLEVNRTRLTDIGIKWPDQLTLTALGTGVLPGAVTVATSPTLTQLKHINSDNIVTSPSMSVALKAMMQDSDTNILASPRIRARNREKAKIMIGDRVPVITNAVTPVATGSPVVTGNVQYLDVGLKLEVEPDIRLNNEVAIRINLDVSSIVKEVQNTMSGTLAYQIGTRNASTLLQLKDGETQILAGLIDNQQRNSASKIPGLGQLPLLGRLFSEHNDNGSKTEVILSITPHVIGKVHQPKASEVEYWSGTESNVHSRPVTLKQVKVAVTSNNASLASPAIQTENAQQTVPVLAGTDTPDAAAVTPLVLSWQGPSQAKVGDKISLTLNTQSTQGVKSLGFLVGFDPNVLKAVDVIEGSFLKQGNSPSKLAKVIDQTSGQILVDLSSTAATGASGTGSVVAVVFEVTRAASQSQITTSQILPLGSAGETLAFNAPPPYAIEVGQ
jgi:general secretion pathway protein D